jgi:hypothetical protein
MSYEEEDTCMSYEEEDTCIRYAHVRGKRCLQKNLKKKKETKWSTSGETMLMCAGSVCVCACVCVCVCLCVCVCVCVCVLLEVDRFFSLLLFKFLFL